MSDPYALRDVVALVLAIRRDDLDGFTKIASEYGFDQRQEGLVRTAIALLALHPTADLESFALYLGAKP